MSKRGNHLGEFSDVLVKGKRQHDEHGGQGDDESSRCESVSGILEPLDAHSAKQRRHSISNNHIATYHGFTITMSVAFSFTD